jgi:hypothetical protein
MQTGVAPAFSSIWPPRAWTHAVSFHTRPPAAAGRYPVLTRWLADPAGPSPDEQFKLGLNFLLDGIASRLPHRPPQDRG